MVAKWRLSPNLAAMFIVDDCSLSFEIPARDSLGRDAVEGQIAGTQDRVLFTWRLKDRTFRKGDADMKSVEIPYAKVEKVLFKATLGFLNPRLIFDVVDPQLLANVPGTDVGKATLRLPPKSKEAARKFIKMVDFKRTEEAVKISRTRLLDISEAGKFE